MISSLHGVYSRTALSTVGGPEAVIAIRMRVTTFKTFQSHSTRGRNRAVLNSACASEIIAFKMHAEER